MFHLYSTGACLRSAQVVTNIEVLAPHLHRLAFADGGLGAKKLAPNPLSAKTNVSMNPESIRRFIKGQVEQKGENV